MSQPFSPPPPHGQPGHHVPQEPWAPAQSAAGPQPWTPEPHHQPAPAAEEVPFHKKPWFLVVAGLLVVGMIGSALDEDDTETTAVTAPATVTVTAEPSPSTEVAPPPPAEEPVDAPAPPPAPVVVDFVMPDFTGMDLQSAQNTVQSNGVFLSRSHDLLGGRSQMLDSNWIVCTQNIAPGQRVTGDVEGQIDFGSVKRGESCP